MSARPGVGLAVGPALGAVSAAVAVAVGPFVAVPVGVVAVIAPLLAVCPQAATRATARMRTVLFTVTTPFRAECRAACAGRTPRQVYRRPMPPSGPTGRIARVAWAGSGATAALARSAHVVDSQVGEATRERVRPGGNGRRPALSERISGYWCARTRDRQDRPLPAGHCTVGRSWWPSRRSRPFDCR